MTGCRFVRSFRRVGLFVAMVAAVYLSFIGATHAATILQTTADNWVHRDDPNSSFWNVNYLALRGTLSRSDAKEAFIEFQVPNCTFDTAILRLMGWNFGTNLGSIPLDLQVSLVPVPVSVNSLTWNTRPGSGPVLGTASVQNGLAEISLNAGSIPAGTTIVLRLTFTENGWGNFESLESTGLIPELELRQGFSDVTAGALASTAYGVAWGDYDNDGDDDIYLARSDGTAVPGVPNKLLRNDNGVFSDVSSPPVEDWGDAAAASWVDYDNDGDLDLYVANDNGQANKMFRNNGNGQFTSAATGVLADAGYGRAVAWGDYDEDGWLDLYIANSGPSAQNRLLHNSGDGTFSDVTTPTLEQPVSSHGVVWIDYDGDNDLDLYVGSYGSANKLFRNDGGTFTDVANPLLNDAGTAIGVACGDYDNDGDLDLYVANALNPNLMFRNDGGGVFSDATVGPLAGNPSPSQGNGAAWADYDNDGDLDLYLSNGANGGANQLLDNRGSGEFVDVTAAPLAQVLNNLGSAWSDYDGDGDLDLYVANNQNASKLLRADGCPDNHWIHIDLVGTESNRFGVGARIRIVAAGISQTQWVSAGTGGGSQNSLTAEFGLGAATLVDTIEVTWPTDRVERKVGVAADQRITMRELLPQPQIGTIEDVPNDQGGWLRITFDRSFFDTEGSPSPVTTYGIYRRVDNPMLLVESGDWSASQMVFSETGRDHAPFVDRKTARAQGWFELEGGRTHFLSMAAPSGTWEAIGTVPARQTDQYIYLAPSVGDSSTTIPYSVFFISAYTTTPAIYFDSLPDSGYSVDNIAPGAPQNFMAMYEYGSGFQLTWDAAPEPDFQYYKIYRDNSLVHTTATTSWTDSISVEGTVHYEVSAVDHAGNEGDPAEADATTGVAPVIPERFALYQNVPNPFNPSTVIVYDLPPGGGRVTLRIYDVAGRLVREFVDDTNAPGRKQVVWDGRSENGRLVSGIYFYRLTASGFEQTKKMVLLK